MIDDRHSKKTGAVTGNVIDFGATDVQSAIDEIGAARFALVAGVWDKLAPGMGAHAAGAAGSLIGERLRSGRWRQAEGLARVQQAFAADAKAAAIAKVHRWLARDIGLVLRRSSVNSKHGTLLGCPGNTSSLVIS